METLFKEINTWLQRWEKLIEKEKVILFQCFSPFLFKSSHYFYYSYPKSDCYGIIFTKIGSFLILGAMTKLTKLTKLKEENLNLEVVCDKIDFYYYFIFFFFSETCRKCIFSNSYNSDSFLFFFWFLNSWLIWRDLKF